MNFLSSKKQLIKAVIDETCVVNCSLFKTLNALLKKSHTWYAYFRSDAILSYLIFVPIIIQYFAFMCIYMQIPYSMRCYCLK